MSHAQFQFLSEFASGLRPESDFTETEGNGDTNYEGYKQTGVLYTNVDRRLMIVDESIHEPVKKHWKTNKSRFES